ncbi:hypothetical protein [Spartinivicinus poritis]|uniref:Uncharacterized protein n=1 Tax=Spartinivicinus poritis TaxID=2994640 RepID=A0ABT5UET9_9GAMM|nr:hypothetical protein [Spartinivicinus sp. A2-2]MDE1463993.1 hypothetical protein [Spartinivicinus sp. A2-2]
MTNMSYQFICLRIVTLLLLVTLQLGCQQNSSDITWHNSREYTLQLYNNGMLVLNAEVNYLGKQPPVDVDIKHNWQQQDTDFYSVKFTNQYQRSIHFEKIIYQLEKGKLFSQKIKDKQEIAEDYGFVKILPGNSLLDESSYVWSYADSNILHRYFHFTVDGEHLTADLPLVYQK